MEKMVKKLVKTCCESHWWAKQLLVNRVYEVTEKQFLNIIMKQKLVWIRELVE